MDNHGCPAHSVGHTLTVSSSSLHLQPPFPPNVVATAMNGASFLLLLNIRKRTTAAAPIFFFLPPDASQSSIIILIYQRKMRTVGKRRTITYYATTMAQRQNIFPSAANTTHPTSPSLRSLDNYQLRTYARSANYQICPSHNISIPKAKEPME